MLMISHIIINNDLKKLGKSCSRMSCGIFRTGLRAPRMVLGGALVPVGTVLLTPCPRGTPRTVKCCKNCSTTDSVNTKIIHLKIYKR